MNNQPLEAINMDARTFFNHPDTTYIFGDLLNGHDWVLLRAALGERVCRTARIEAAAHYATTPLLDEYISAVPGEYILSCLKSKAAYDWFSARIHSSVINAAIHQANPGVLLTMSEELIPMLMQRIGSWDNSLLSKDIPWGDMPRPLAEKLILEAGSRALGGFIPWADLRNDHISRVPPDEQHKFIGRADCIDTSVYVYPDDCYRMLIYGGLRGEDDLIQWMIREARILADPTFYVLVYTFTRSPDPEHLLERLYHFAPDIYADCVWRLVASYPGSPGVILARLSQTKKPTIEEWRALADAAHVREYMYELYPSELVAYAARYGVVATPGIIRWLLGKGYRWDGESQELNSYRPSYHIGTHSAEELAEYYYCDEPRSLAARRIVSVLKCDGVVVKGYLELGFKLNRKWVTTVLEQGSLDEVDYLIGVLTDPAVRHAVFGAKR